MKELIYTIQIQCTIEQRLSNVIINKASKIVDHGYPHQEYATVIKA